MFLFLSVKLGFVRAGREKAMENGSRRRPQVRLYGRLWGGSAHGGARGPYDEAKVEAGFGEAGLILVPDYR